MIPRVLRCVVAFAWLVFAMYVATAARADIIANTFGPGDSYDGSGYHVFGPSAPDGPISVAVPFTTPVLAAADTVDLAMYYRSGGNRVVFSLVQDSSGTPTGTALTTQYFDDAVQVRPGSVISWQIMAGVYLYPNQTYWLVASGFRDFAGEWNLNDQDYRGLAVNYGSGWTFDSGSIAPVYRVSTFPVAAVVPEPSVIAFGMIAAASVLGLVTRKRRK